MHSNSYAIIGTGAVGGYYGALLQRAGFDVHFLLHSDYEHAQRHGLKIESTTGDFELPSINAYNRADKLPKCDVAIIALKTTANAALPEILPHALKENGCALTLQNGLGSEQQIASIIGSDRVMGGLCFLCSNKIGPGHIRHLDYGLITLGEFHPANKPGGITPRLQTLGNDFEAAGIPIKLIEDLALARWKKLVWNIPFNGLAVVHNCLTDHLVHTPEIRERCIALMQEVAAGASACCGRPIESEFLEKMIVDTERMKPYAPSMKLDFDHGRPMEIESIYGIPTQTAAAAGFEMTETRKLYHELNTIASQHSVIT